MLQITIRINKKERSSRNPSKVWLGITFEPSDERGNLPLRQSRLNSNSLCHSLLILRLIDLKNVDCSTLIAFFLNSAKYNDLPDLGRNNYFLWK